MDVFGVVYIIENAQQFWSGVSHAHPPPRFPVTNALTIELEDILRIPNDASLTKLDATLARFVTFCANYHGQELVCQQLLDFGCLRPRHRAIFADASPARACLLFAAK